MKSLSLRIMVVVVMGLAAAGCGALISPQHRIERARADIATGQWGAAAIELRQALKSEPHNTEAWLVLAHLSLVAANPGEAYDDVNRALKYGAKGPKVDALRVRTWLATGRAKALLGVIQQGKLRLPEPDRSVAIARAYNQLQQPAQALAALQNALAVNPVPTAVRLAAATALALQGNSDLALQQLGLAASADPHSVAAPLLRGQILASRGQFAAAAAALTIAAHRVVGATTLQKRVAAYAGLADSHLALGEIRQAAKDSAVLTKLAPTAPIAQLIAARIQIAHGDRLGGIGALERLVADVPTYVEARMLLGAAQLERGDFEQARENLEQVIQQAPDNLQARELLARVRLKLHQPGEALKILAPELGTHSMDPQLYALIGAAGRRAGHPDAALQALVHTARARPGDLALQLELAQAYLGANRASDALALLEKLKVSGGDMRRDTLLLAAIGAVKGPAAQTQAAQQLVATHPKSLPMRDLAAVVYASQRRFAHARALLQQALAIAPKDLPTLATLARVDLASGDLKDANAALDTALATQPGNAALANGAGLLLLQANQYEAALARFHTACKLAPRKAAYWFNAGRAQLASNQSAAARESLRKAAQLEPDWLAPVSALALIDLRDKHAPRAIARVQRYLAAHPDDPAALTLQGEVAATAGQYPDAQRAFEAAMRRQPSAALAVKLFEVRRAARLANPQKPLLDWLARRPDDAAVRMELAAYDMAQSSMRAAQQQLQQVLSEAPNYVIALNNLAWVDSKLGDAHAEALAERAYQLAPKQANVADTLGWILAGKHQTQRALPLLAQAVKAAPADPQMQYHYAYALAEAGRGGEARAILGKLLAGKASFPARAAAVRLYAKLKS
ncbi:MAG: tetratricopeptide repeat protein [Steroidobacteraceae bacterium]|nr:tetratricopeptide repeat protein [Steroidobacteraceae bacterium]